jgi:hypothetical protein
MSERWSLIQILNITHASVHLPLTLQCLLDDWDEQLLLKQNFKRSNCDGSTDP